ncbi:hypothetical protein [Chachezhania sediminis]|uniref:hypothetical protein n=1 Tax=Chachezhania sediminis TaxID=2599291 RepID=UPI00131C94D6|nr:hypothetical protein [Chachezhania sediminis]
MEDDDRLVAWLQNRLDPAARAAFEAEMAADPDLRAAATALRAAADELGNRPVPEGMKEAGWDRLSRAIDADRIAAPANLNRGLTALKVAGIVVATIVFWQFGVAPRLPEPGAGFAPASVSVAGPALRLAFTETAPAAEVTALLQSIGATVIDGPGALGLYTIGFADAAARDAAEAALSDRPDLVMAVTRP